MAVSSVNRLRPADVLDHHPSQPVSDAQTATGSTVNLRPIRSSDGPRLCRFHESLSAHSVNLRYSFMHPRLSPAEVELFTHVDNVDRLDLIGEDQGRIIAVGRYERIPGTTQAEVAFVVADTVQHQGIKSALLARMAEAAVANGITTFVAQTLTENRAVIDVFMQSGYPITSSCEHGTIHIRFPITGSGSLPVADDNTAYAHELSWCAQATTYQ